MTDVTKRITVAFAGGNNTNDRKFFCVIYHRWSYVVQKSANFTDRLSSALVFNMV